MKMNARMDEGEIISQAPFTILPEDTYASLREKMSYQSGNLLAYTLPSYVEGKIELQPQEPLITKLIEDKKITSVEDVYTKLFTKDSGFVAFDNPPAKAQLNNMIRGLYPWPGVWTRYQGKVVKLLPGKKVQMEGRSEVSLKDFKNGHKDFTLDF